MAQIRTLLLVAFILNTQLQVYTQDNSTIKPTSPISKIHPKFIYKIIGGEETNRGDYPFMVSLQEEGEHFCGGSILNTRAILTAAHCVHGISDDDKYVFGVLVGTNDLDAGNGVRHAIKRYIIHDKYAMSINDVAIVFLETTIRFTIYTNKIDLSPLPVNVGTAVTAIGWGKITRYGRLSRILKRVSLKIVEMTECTNEEIKYHEEIQICIGINEQEAIGEGDSGGPIISGGLQVGIDSEEGTFEISEFATKISRYTDWINSCLVEFKNNPL